MTIPDESRRARIAAHALIRILANGRVYRLPPVVREEAQRIYRHLELCDVSEYDECDASTRRMQAALKARRILVGERQ